MDTDSQINPESKIDTLLDHQTQRLEDIANNAVDFIKINLLILGVFAPFSATILGNDIIPEDLFQSSFFLYGMIAWTGSTLLSTVVYRIARDKSTSQFGMLEQAILGNWRSADLRDEMIDNSDKYENIVSKLVIATAVSVGFSLTAVLFLAVGIADAVFGFDQSFKNESLRVIILFGLLVGFGIEFWGLTIKVPSRIQGFITETLVYSKVKNVIFNFVSPTIIARSGIDDIIEYLVSVEELSGIRARLLVTIRRTMGLKPWTFDELSTRLESENPDVGLTQGMIQRLVNDGYLRRIDEPGPSTIIVHERKEEIVNDAELDKIVGEELGRLIGHMRQDDSIKASVAEALDVDIENVKNELVSGTTSDRIDKLNHAIEHIRNTFPEKHPSGKEYGKISFRSRAIRYQISPKGIRSFALVNIDRAKRALHEGLVIQASVLATRGLEEFLRCLLFNHDQSIQGSRPMGLMFLIDKTREKGLLEIEEFDDLHRLREIRNKAVHEADRQIEQSEVEELINVAEKVIWIYSYDI